MSTSSSGTVTFQPGGLAVGPPVFSDFGALSTYITGQQTTNGVTDWTILIDGSLTGGSPFIQSTITGYPLPLSVSFVGLAQSDVESGYPTLNGDDVFFTGANAVSFTNLPFVQINNLSGPPVFSISGTILVPNPTFNVDLTNTNILAGFNPFFSVTNGADIDIRLHGSAVLGSEPISSTVVTVDGTSTASVIAYDASELVSGAISLDPGGALSIYLVDSATVDSSYSSMSGTSVNLLSVAPEVSYNPSVPTNWPTPPTQVAEALDELAANQGDSSQIATLTAQVATLTSQVAALSASDSLLKSQVAALQQQQAETNSSLSSLPTLTAQMTALQQENKRILCLIHRIESKRCKKRKKKSKLKTHC